jgi:hypothetical protein
MTEIRVKPWHTDPNQPHMLVYYDETYLAIGDADYDPTDYILGPQSGKLKASCQLFYIPVRLIVLFKSLHQAFGYLTKKADIHFADYDAEAIYHANGTYWDIAGTNHFPELIYVWEYLCY